ncbi:MAG TPA: PGPGW domain-containing protein [Lacipirellulaceae bacterium]
MGWIAASWDSVKSHPELLAWASAASLVMFLSTPIAVGWLVIRLPTDYFTQERQLAATAEHRHPLLRLFVLVSKNLAGIVLLLAGLVMLVTPGQGLLTMAVGLTLINFPGKSRFERWLAMRPPVWQAINWLRRRAGRDALEQSD